MVHLHGEVRTLIQARIMLVHRIGTRVAQRSAAIPLLAVALLGFPASASGLPRSEHKQVIAHSSRTSSISGKVTTVKGVPLSGICVNTQGGFNFVKTGGGGIYLMKNLSPGKYFISFGSCGNGPYVGQYYNGTASGAPTPFTAKPLG